MNPEYKRIAGIHIEDDGGIAAVWLAHDKMSDVVTVYDACKFASEVFAVVAEGMNARARWIPIAWSDKAKDFSGKLLDRGCNMLHDPVSESPAMADLISRDISERMRTGRFKVDRRLSEWMQEFEVFSKHEGQIPVAGYPLMAATRYAIADLPYAKRLQVVKQKPRFPKVAMI